MILRASTLLSLIAFVLTTVVGSAAFSQDKSPKDDMSQSWGKRVIKLRADNAERGQLFDEGNYAMFIHWGVYSQLANKVEGKTYYGIGEWIMNKNMANIPIDKYKELATTFNPLKFEAATVVKTAKDAGMKYIIITAKHHDGFAMYHSKCNKAGPAKTQTETAPPSMTTLSKSACLKSKRSLPSTAPSNWFGLTRPARSPKNTSNNWWLWFARINPTL